MVLDLSKIDWEETEKKTPSKKVEKKSNSDWSNSDWIDLTSLLSGTKKYTDVVEIKEAVRDPGGRAKVAVYSTDPDTDPVGACVGLKGQRVKNIVTKQVIKEKNLNQSYLWYNSN